MSMNIGPMLRAMMGDAQPADGRALELKVGQIVRGVILELLENQEALVNINGVQVKAKLDAEIQVGKSTLLQVQSGGTGGLVTLKTLADLSEMLPEEGLKDVLKTFGLPEQKWAMDMLRGLKRDGHPIGKEAAAYFNTAAALKPAGVDAASWASASDVAFRRGLTPTETTISSLRQALFGQPIHEELANLRTAVESWLGGAKAPSADAAALGQKLQSLLSQGAALLAEGETQLSGDEGTSQSATSKGSDGDKTQAANLLRNAATGSTLSGELNKTATDAAATKGDVGAGKVVSNAASQATPPVSVAPQAGAGGASAAQPDASRAAALPNNAPPAAAFQAPSVAENQAAAANRPATAANASAVADSARAMNQADASQSSAPKSEAAWIGRFLQWLGVGHERQLMHNVEPRMLPGDNAGLPVGTAAALASGADAPGQESRPAAESLKGALLALATHDDVPPMIREAAQTLANQVTGQQLLLSSDRSTVAPFSHMTLFVPMKGSDGDTTATVHVQTRRSRRGEWDVDNCHMLFDLKMRNLGDTLVDVQVVDRIVSLKLLSDFPGMPLLLDAAREELATGMSSAGFQLLSLTTSPLPQWKSGSAASALSSASGEKGTAIASAYATKPYKGVDYKA
ncbi:hypothetical protein [Cohnella sp. WQ 127256]|uniref:hypothetical protein n=1 Tax=Cohnella sp. WQ 127256 TaxID=2938790 RepID=UPI0021180F1F|nr:hypothetical protein [Cohnella sp. WQ 127256]